MSFGLSTLSTDGFVRGIGNGLSLFNKASAQISSGFLINSAADGPASLILSENLRSRVNSLATEIENVSALIDKYDYASSHMQELRSQLIELRGLAVSAANEGGNDPSQQSVYSAVGNHIVETYNRQVESAEYNGSTLFDGSSGSLTKLSPLTGIDLSTAAKADESISKIDSYLADFDKADIEIGSEVRYGLESEQRNLELTRQNLMEAESMIRDVDYAGTVVMMIRGEMQARASAALLSHALMTESVVMGVLGRMNR